MPIAIQRPVRLVIGLTVVLPLAALLAARAAAQVPADGGRGPEAADTAVVLARLAARFGPPSPLDASRAAKTALRTRPYQTILQQPEPAAALEACIDKEMTAMKIPGASVAVMQDGQLVFNYGYGQKKPGDPAAGMVDAETQFRIGSITKMMTAAALLQQVEAGRVNLDDPVQEYIPGFTTQDTAWTAAMTVRQLLSHATGFPDNALVTAAGELAVDGPKTEDALATWAISQTNVYLHAPPGTLWNYSNPNFMLAGLVAEKTGGKPYHRLMTEDLWAKAGLTSTTLLPAEVLQRGNYTYGIWTNPFVGKDEVEAPDSYDNWAAAPAGYAFSTAGDLVRWADLLMAGGGTVLRPESVAAMTGKQQYMNYRPYQYYGFGVFYDKYQSLEVREHGGNIPGWGGALAWVPSAHFAVAALNNSFPASMMTSAFCAIEAYLKPAPDPDPDYRTDPATWTEYVGAYGGRDVLGGIAYVDVTLEDRKLMATFPETILPDGQPYKAQMAQALLDTFVVDLDGDGKPETDFTFIADKTDAGVTWLRARQWVGRRPALVPRPTPAPTTVAPTPTPRPDEDITVSGVVYNVRLGEDHPVAGAVVYFQPCVPHQAFSATTDAAGRYRLLMPGSYVAGCGSTLRLGVYATGYRDLAQTFSPSELRAQPLRNFGLEPDRWGVYLPLARRE